MRRLRWADDGSLVVLCVLKHEFASCIELSELPVFGLGALAQHRQFEVGHLVSEDFEDLALLDVQGLTFTAHIDV